MSPWPRRSYPRRHLRRGRRSGERELPREKSLHARLTGDETPPDARGKTTAPGRVRALGARRRLLQAGDPRPAQATRPLRRVRHHRGVPARLRSDSAVGERAARVADGDGRHLRGRLELGSVPHRHGGPAPGRRTHVDGTWQAGSDEMSRTATPSDKKITKADIETKLEE